MRTDATPAATTITTVPLTELVPDWLISLDAGNKSSATIKVYAYGVNAFLRWHEREFPAAPPVIDRKTVELWLAELRREGKAPATRRLWFAAMKLFTAWLADPDVAELERDPLARMKAPPAGNPSVRSLADSDIGAMLKACRGTTFADRRDKAMIIMLASTGMRAGELMALTVADVDVPGRTITIRHGKGD
jgi:site-specific recombinase XerD